MYGNNLGAEIIELYIFEEALESSRIWFKTVYLNILGAVGYFDRIPSKMGSDIDEYAILQVKVLQKAGFVVRLNMVVEIGVMFYEKPPLIILDNIVSIKEIGHRHHEAQLSVEDCNSILEAFFGEVSDFEKQTSAYLKKIISQTLCKYGKVMHGKK